MFERKKPPQPKRIDSLIGAGTIVDGDVTFSGGLRVDGAVRGKVATVDSQPATLVLSEQARIEGEVRVSHVVINGVVNGPVTANDYLELQAKARVNGDVVYRTLEMHVGAVVQGKLMHAEQESAAVVELRRATGE
ncbi:MAG TPA: polymer-forming cytoskeletal protein [Casimicrobiaceae bacterium]|jgi:cytoskeletal protein CcmA (bactofilin family)|nr:polymer-forming cytoskeletal protein [Casimicrobiaceae bacterium]